MNTLFFRLDLTILLKYYHSAFTQVSGDEIRITIFFSKEKKINRLFEYITKNQAEVSQFVIKPLC